MKRLILTLLLFAAPLASAAQIGVIQHTANLRRDPSATHAPIRKLFPDEKVEVQGATQGDYVKVKTEDQVTGWVFKTFVKVLDTPAVPPTTPAVPPSPPPAPSVGGGPEPAASIPPNLPKQTPVVQPFNGVEGACQPNGDGADTKTNFLKNRSDALPAQVFDAAWSAVMGLSFPAAPTSRLKWKAADLAQIQPFEGDAVRTIGFLSHQVKVESGGNGESTNCHFTDPADVDWHLYLVAHPMDGIDKAVIIETTPRIRKQRQWDADVLRRWVDTDKPVRISGYLMVDPEHRSMIGTARGTVWEIHPIMKIEVCNKSASCTANEWVDLEQVH